MKINTHDRDGNKLKKIDLPDGLFSGLHAGGSVAVSSSEVKGNLKCYLHIKYNNFSIEC